MVTEFGFNLLHAYDPNDLNAARAGGLSIVYLQEHADQIPHGIDKSPLTVARSFHKDANGGPFQLGQKSSGWLTHADKHLDMTANAERANAQGKIFYLAGPNETHNNMMEFGRFEAERAVGCHKAGARAVIGNFGMGVPTPENMTVFFTAFYGRLKELNALATPFAIGFHEYGGIWPWMWLGDFQGLNIDPSKADYEADKLPAIPKPGELGWLIGRFQIYYQVVPDVLASLGLDASLIDVPELIIMETGLDIVESEKWELPRRKNGDAFGGWRTCTHYWKSFYDTPWAKMYGRIVQWIHAYYSQFDQVIYVSVFGDGPHHSDDKYPEGRFVNYDIGGNDKVIPAMIASKPPTPTPEDPPEPPTPEPTPEPPTPEPVPEPPIPTPPPLPDITFWMEKPIVWDAFFNLIQVIVKAAGRNPDSVMAAIRAALL